MQELGLQKAIMYGKFRSRYKHILCETGFGWKSSICEDTFRTGVYGDVWRRQGEGNQIYACPVSGTNSGLHDYHQHLFHHHFSNHHGEGRENIIF